MGPLGGVEDEGLVVETPLQDQDPLVKKGEVVVANHGVVAVAVLPLHAP